MNNRAVTSAQAATELMRRRKARASLVDYSQAIAIPGAPVSDSPDEWMFAPIETSVALHHRVIMQACQECIEQDYGRLMIFAPPGSAKSSYAAVVAPTWAMGRFPGSRVLTVSYASAPIIRASKRSRQICKSDAYRSIWETPATITPGSSAADEWELDNGSGLFAVGMLGGVTSTRCDFGVIDDPVSGREDAESETMRRKTLDAYHDDFLTRLKPKASIILIQTRWHQDDLAGHILPEDYRGQSGLIKCRDGQVWNVLSIPAQADAADDPLGRDIGDYLWPEWFSARHWDIYKGNGRTWSSLYQQKPIPDDGIYFKKADFLRHEPGTAPEHLTYYMASDFATKDGDGDRTEHGICGIDDKYGLWFEAGDGGQLSTDKGIAKALALTRSWSPTLWLGEKGPIESAIGPTITQQMEILKTWVARWLLPSIANKVQRARGLMAAVEGGRVSVVTGEWGDALIDQMVSFPGGRYDDKVDMASLIGRAADIVARGGKPESNDQRPPTIPFTRRHIEGLDRHEHDQQRRKRLTR